MVARNTLKLCVVCKKVSWGAVSTDEEMFPQCIVHVFSPNHDTLALLLRFKSYRSARFSHSLK